MNWLFDCCWWIKNDSLIWLDGALDPYDTPNSGTNLLSANTNAINNIIGFGEYDIGHIYTLGCNDTGGVAIIRSACSGSKGAGVTCHANPNTDWVTINIAAHEFGHQLGANHSFNNCNGNENFGTAYEPGSGSTIMSYAGLCGPNNVQATHDEYFHSISLQEIFNYTRDGNGNTCATKIQTDNSKPIPEHDYSSGFFVPVGTPFELEGRAMDLEDDAMSYSWEQYNLGPQSTLGQPIDNAPSFRAIQPDAKGNRIFPKMSSIIANAGDVTEVLPSRARNFNFRFIARDNHFEGGGIEWVDLQFASTESAGPFLINYPNEDESLTIGDEIEITWDVAGTDTTPVNCEFVEILLSLDGGMSYPRIIRSVTANDGREKIIVPNVPTDDARIKIKSIDNIFFDISNTDFAIVEPTEPRYFIEPVSPVDYLCIPDVIDIPIFTTSFQGYDEVLRFEITKGLPEGATASFPSDENALNDTTLLQLEFSDEVSSGLYELELRSISSAQDTLFRSISFEVINTVFEDIELFTPENGSSGIGGLPEFDWSQFSVGDQFEIILSTNPSFVEETIIEQQLTDTSYFIGSQTLDINQLYFWQVQEINACSQSGYSEISAFHTETLSCSNELSLDTPTNISASGTRTIESSIFISEGGEVRDVNVIKVMGNHEQVSDLTMSLISPAGTVVVLFDRECGNLANFDMGFDDDSPVEINCPVTGGVRFNPVDSLGIFNGEDAAGQWTLRIEDKSPGFGGALNHFELEICTNIAVNPPFIVNNNQLETPPDILSKIKSDLLRVDDQNTEADQLTYTLVSLPGFGQLSLDGQPLAVGDQFTQADIDQELFRYLHDGSPDQEDSFSFVVEDGQGGWIEITPFQIMIDADFTSSTEDPLLSAGIKIYPSPASDRLYIEFTDERSVATTIRMHSMTGKLYHQIKKDKSDQKIEISVRNLPKGIYIVSFENEQGRMAKKVVVH